MGKDVRVRQTSEDRLQDSGEGGFADPAKSEAGDRDAKLNGVKNVVELLMKLLDGASPDSVGGDKLLQTRLADAHQSEFGGHEKRVSRDEQNHCYDAQHNESNHEGGILAPAETTVPGGRNFKSISREVGRSLLRAEVTASTAPWHGIWVNRG